MRTVIFGADGLAFRVIHPLMERGYLPNFRKLQEQGCEAVLESKYPPLTPPAWTSLSTGLKPAKHGVYDFWTYEEEAKTEGVSSGRKASVQTHRKGGKAIWNILSEYGKQVIVLNIPITYPPEPVNGIMVSGYLTPSSDVEFTYPASFKEELFHVAPDYKIDIKLRDIFMGKVETRVDRLVDATLAMTASRIQLMTYLLTEKPWDFCYVVFVGPDRLQHSLWDEIIGLDPKTIEYFSMLDSALGIVLEQLTPEDSLFVVSDHGFQGISRSFDINEYLFSQGLLKLHSTIQREKASRRANIRHALQMVGLHVLAQKVKRSLKSAGIIKKRKGGIYKPALTDIDFAHSLAYVPSMSGFGGGFADIFLDPALSPERISKLCHDLKQQIDPVSGQPLIDAIYSTEVYGEGPFAPREQHLILLPTDGITFTMGLGNKRFWNDAFTNRDSKKRRGSHQKDGVLYAYGNGLKQGFRAPNAEICDLVPTVLRHMGLPFPHEFDGKMLEDLFVEQERQDQGANTDSGLARRKLKKLLEI